MHAGEKYRIARVAAVLLAVSFVLAGCGKRGVFDGSRTSNEDGFRMEYEILNKEETADLKLSEGEQLKVSILQTAGKVDVTVGQSGEEAIYKGAGQENAEFILTIPKTGNYHISVTGHQAKGTVSFTRITEP